MEDQKCLAISLDHVLPNGGHTVDFSTGPKRAREVALHLVHFDDADHLEHAAGVPDTEHEPSPGPVGEG